MDSARAVPVMPRSGSGADMMAFRHQRRCTRPPRAKRTTSHLHKLNLEPYLGVGDASPRQSTAVLYKLGQKSCSLGCFGCGCDTFDPKGPDELGHANLARPRSRVAPSQQAGSDRPIQRKFCTELNIQTRITYLSCNVNSIIYSA